MQDHEYQVKSTCPDGRVIDGKVTSDPKEAGAKRREAQAIADTMGGDAALYKRAVTRGPWEKVE